MSHVHEPDPAFVENLEWQLKTAVRRRERFAEPVSRRVPSLARMAGLVLLSVTVGAAGAVTAGKLQDGEKTALLLQQNGIQVGLAGRKVEGASAALELAQARHDQGIVASSEVREAERRLLAERFALQGLELERAEMQLSGGRAVLAFSAPLVAGRDFVTERLVLELAYERARLRLVDEECEKARRLSEVGAVGPGAVDELEARAFEGRARIEALEEELLLRSLFLSGEYTPEEVELRRLRLELQVRRKGLRARHERVQGETLRTRTLVDQGLVPQSELRDLQLELDSLEAELQGLELEARILDAELGIELPELREEPTRDPEELEKAKGRRFR